MIYLHKILPLFLSPLVIVCVMLLIAVMRRQRGLSILALIILYVSSIPLTAVPVSRYVEGHALKFTEEDAPQADAVVVLGGMLDWIQTTHGIRTEWIDSDRFWDGIALVKAGRAPLLVFTGGKLPWQIGDETEGDALKRYAMMVQVPESQILVTDKVENTDQEANAVSEKLGASRRRIILVTSAFHMKRAKALFERQGFEVFAYPVDFRSARQMDWKTAFFPYPYALFSNDYNFRELLGRAFYAVKHKFDSPQK